MNRRISALTAVLLGFALVAGACGSDGDQPAPAATTAAPADPADPAAAGLARAQAHVDVLNADATSIGTDVPLTRVPDPGKRIVVLA